MNPESLTELWRWWKALYWDRPEDRRRTVVEVGRYLVMIALLWWLSGLWG